MERQQNNYCQTPKSIVEKLSSAESFREVIKNSLDILNAEYTTSYSSAFVNLKNSDYTAVFPKDSDTFLPKSIEQRFNLDSNILTWSNDDLKEFDSLVSFLNLSSHIKQLILVPIRGQKRILSILTLGFSEIYEINPLFINLIASHASNYGTFHLRKDMLLCLEEIRKHSTDYLSDRIPRQTYIDRVCDSVIQKDGVNYSACLVRLISEKESAVFLESKACSENISWKNLKPAKYNELMYAKYLNSKGNNPLFVDSINREHKLVNYGWVDDNRIKAFARVPIEIDDMFFGVLSICIAYEYKFYSFDHMFLRQISAEIAHTLFSHDIKMRLREEREDAEKTANLSKITYSSLVDKLHTIKNDLYFSNSSLKDYRNHKDIDNVVLKLKKNIETLEELLSDSQSGNVNIALNYSDVNKALLKVIKDTVLNFGDEIEITYEIPRNQPYLVQGDENTLTSIFRDLLGNAVKSCILSKKNEKMIMIRSFIERDRSNLDWVTVWIFDNGVGIRKEFSDRIYDENFSGFGDSNSTGKGLFLVKNSINANNGEITHVSTYGDSTTFMIRFLAE